MEILIITTLVNDRKMLLLTFKVMGRMKDEQYTRITLEAYTRHVSRHEYSNDTLRDHTNFPKNVKFHANSSHYWK